MEISDMSLERIAIALERIADALEARNIEERAGEAEAQWVDEPAAAQPFADAPPDGETPLGEAPLRRVNGAQGAGEQSEAAQKTQFPRLSSFLRRAGIEITRMAEPENGEEALNRIALFMGQRYDALSGVLARIKRAQPTGGAFTEVLRGQPQEVIGSVCQFCAMMHQIGFLEEYHYRRAPSYTVHGKTTRMPRAQNFFSGKWLERYIAQAALDVVARSDEAMRSGIEMLRNAQIRLPNGADFELDLLIGTGDRVYWVEAKTGNYQQYLARYTDFARMAGLDARHAFLALTDMDEEAENLLSGLYNITVCDMSRFADRLAESLRADGFVLHSEGAADDEPEVRI